MKKIKLLRDIIEEISEMQNMNDVMDVLNSCDEYPEVFNNVDMKNILNSLRSFVKRSMEGLCQSSDGVSPQHIAKLSDVEKAELAEANKIIDNNLFSYHFQPIVNTKDGDIYSFEALMRPKGDLCKSPDLILKYAEITNRLVDIERMTFTNILRIVSNNIEKVGTRRVFINSIPKVRLGIRDLAAILPPLLRYSDNIVIEMTEQSEITERELYDIKRLYNSLGIHLAVDDYGTGYSNIENLIRYTPNYVKIDRSLISAVNTSHKKQHFVREIVKFCHDNNTLALAEGVETREELRSVISLGVDLIQGYYTAPPCEIIIESIPENIREEIRHWRAVCNRDRSVGIFRTNGTDKIHLDHLDGTDYHCILIGNEENVTKNTDIVITGTPKSDINLVIGDDYCGDIVLNDASLANAQGCPCITIGENCNVRLVLVGINRFLHGGIHVPATSQLIITGKGVIRLLTDSTHFCDIGSVHDVKQDKLLFKQDII